VYNLTNYERREVSVDILLGEMLSGIRVPNIFDYYVTCGFAGFWPQRFSAEADAILNIIVSSPKITYQGINLPAAKITSEPLLLSIFNFNQSDSRLQVLFQQSYLAQELRYNTTGMFTAFSEGFSNAGFVWEWIVLPDGRMWVIQTGDSNNVDTDVVGMTPIVYLKAATGFLAIYNTPYTQNMVSYLLKQLPVSQFGYVAGVDEKGNRISSCDLGNGLILSAAKYGIDNKVNVNFTYPKPEPTATPTPNSVSSTAENTPVPTPPKPLNASDVAPNPSVEPSSSVMPNDSKVGLTNLDQFYVFSVIILICILGAASYWFGKKRKRLFTLTIV
jgi:hypothetical protein